MAEWKFIGARRYECSACGEGIADMPCDWSNGEPLYNFCPYCGANMTMKKADGVKTEPQMDIHGITDCDFCKHGSEEWDSEACDGCCENNDHFEPKDEPTTEDCSTVDKDINVRSKYEPKLSEIPTSKCHYEPKTDCPWK